MQQFDVRKGYQPSRQGRMKPKKQQVFVNFLDFCNVTIHDFIDTPLHPASMRNAWKSIIKTPKHLRMQLVALTIRCYLISLRLTPKLIKCYVCCNQLGSSNLEINVKSMSLRGGLCEETTLTKCKSGSGLWENRRRISRKQGRHEKMKCWRGLQR